MPALRSNAPSGPVHVVSAAMTLAGITAAQFNAAAKTAFIAALAAQLSVATTTIAVTGVTDAPASGRHLLATGAVVAFTVSTLSPSAATAVTTAVTAAGTSTTFRTALNTQLVAAGAPATTGLTLSTAPTTAVSSAAPARAAIGAAMLVSAVLAALL